MSLRKRQPSWPAPAMVGASGIGTNRQPSWHSPTVVGRVPTTTWPGPELDAELDAAANDNCRVLRPAVTITLRRPPRPPRCAHRFFWAPIRYHGVLSLICLPHRWPWSVEYNDRRDGRTLSWFHTSRRQATRLWQAAVDGVPIWERPAVNGSPSGKSAAS